jgi:hypothetical protein
VLAVLARREQLWTIELIDDGSQRCATTPEQRLLAIFDVFDEWFHQRKTQQAAAAVR